MRLGADAAGFCRELWRTWSPGWTFPDAEFEATAQSFLNPDFVDIVMHSYRYRWGYEKPDPKYDDAESFMRGLPAISTPTDSLTRRGGRRVAAQRVLRARSSISQAGTGGFWWKGAGHFAQREMPEIFADAILEIAKTSPE